MRAREVDFRDTVIKGRVGNAPATVPLTDNVDAKKSAIVDGLLSSYSDTVSIAKCLNGGQGVTTPCESYKKRVRFTDRGLKWCPDCGSALFWKRKLK